MNTGNLSSRRKTNINGLPTEVIYCIIDEGIFDLDVGCSHDALHSFREICEVGNDPTLLRAKIPHYFQSVAVSRKASTRWNLYSNLDAPGRIAGISGPPVECSLISWTIKHCPKCFEFLLYNRTIRPFSFTDTGESLYFIAWKNEDKRLQCIIASLMSPEDLMKPATSWKEAGIPTILEYAAETRSTFVACWGVLQKYPSMVVPLSTASRHDICKWVYVDLAEELFVRNINLITSDLSWAHILEQKDPVPMLEWCYKRGRIPKSLLYLTTVHNNAVGTRWASHQNKDYSQWMKAARNSAREGSQESIETFKAVLEFPPVDLDKYAFFDNLAAKFPEEECFCLFPREICAEKIKILRELGYLESGDMPIS